MNDIIHLLPDSVANQIAAGEVVQRPASIVKETVENSIDAGADEIEVRIIDGGKTCVQVIDNGIGMSETDARMAFERHATSKINNAGDIYQLTTMGFRGEALASIAAVAQVEMQTRRKDDEIGTYIQIEGAKVIEQKPVACPSGTNLSIRNLFYNIPVRRKFLKKTQTELNNIIQDFERIALVYPDVDFKLFHNETPVFKLGKCNLKNRIVDICGKKYDNVLLPISTETSLVNVVGFVGKPEFAKRKGSRQFFFVNGRFMKHPYFHTAVERAFDNIVPQGEHVDYFIYLDVDPQNIDVNVHPTKTEIKFENEQIIWQIINASVREAIGKFNEIPPIDFNKSDEDVYIPAMNSSPSGKVKMIHSSSGFNPFDKSNNTKTASSYDWQRLYPYKAKPDTTEYGEVIVNGALSRQVPKQRSIWDDVNENNTSVNNELYDFPYINYKDKYILITSREGIVVIDQHRAHVKILFEEYVERISGHHKMSQGLLFAEIIQLSKSEEIAMHNVAEEINAVGFDLTPLGNGAYSLNGIPTGMEGHDYSKLLHDLLWIASDNKNTILQDLRENLALAMAQHAAIGYGQKLTSEETKKLLTRLMDMKNPFRTPDGKTVMAVLCESDMEKLLK